MLYAHHRPWSGLRHRVKGVLEVNVDSDYSLFQPLRCTRDPIQFELIEVYPPSCSSPILARHYEIVRLRDNCESVVDDMMDQLNPHIKKTNGPPVTRLITRVPSFVEQSYAAV